MAITVSGNCYFPILPRCCRRFGPYRCTLGQDHFGPCSEPSILSMFLDKGEWLDEGMSCEICGEEADTFKDFWRLSDPGKISVEVQASQYIFLCQDCRLGYIDNQNES